MDTDSKSKNPPVVLSFVKDNFTIDTLIHTKLHIPKPTHRLVDRPNLLKCLEYAVNGKLTLLCAPAGFGKTSLASQWLYSSNNLKCVWLSLGGADNDLRSFMTYLVEAFQRVDERIGRITQSMLRSPQMPPISSLITPLVNDITKISEPLILVLDDYHVIDLQDIHDTIDFLLLHQPPQLHQVILTRHDLPFELGRLRAEGNIIELYSDDLRFSREESRAFFKNVPDTSLSLDEMDTLNICTEGWVAGLQLAGLALKGHQEPKHFIKNNFGSHSYIQDYLKEEVLNRQSVEIRTFLLQTSILERFNVSLCDAVTESQNSQNLLAHLQHDNLFLVSLDDSGKWYRYHHLFSDFLKCQLTQTSSEQVAELHQRASCWCSDNSFVDDAINYALVGEDYHFAANLIEQVGLNMVGQARYNSLRLWIDTLPQQLVQERPCLAVLLAWDSVLTGKSNDAIEQLKMVKAGVQLLEKRSETWFEIICQRYLLQGYISRNQGDLKTAITQIKKAQEHLPEYNVFLQCTVYLNLGGNYRIMGDFEAAEEALYRAAAFVDCAESEYPALAAAGFLANIYLHSGQLQKTTRHCERVIEFEYSKRKIPLPAIAYVYVEQGELFYEKNNLDEAEKVLESAIKLGKNVDRVVNIVRAAQLIAMLKQARGEADEANQYIKYAKSLFESNDRFKTNRQIEFDYYQMRLWLLRGDTLPAIRWAHEYEKHRTVNTTWDVLNELSFARALLINHQSDRAIDILNDCQIITQKSSTMNWFIRGLVLKACCYQAMGNNTKALQSLAHALSLAEPEGYIRTFTDEGAPLAKLLTMLMARYAEFSRGDVLFSTEYIRQLLSTIKMEMNAYSKPLYESLTAREKNVLLLLSIGLCNKKVADELNISIGTVKQYNHTIYRKLDVRSRDQAVQRAKELNLLKN
jgi:LuxR family maltose regulon positive regulatory protein